jgi:hypothetical protein
VNEIQQMEEGRAITDRLDGKTNEIDENDS